MRKAVIRGGLAEVRQAARRIDTEGETPGALPTEGGSSVEGFCAAARAIADAPDLDRAALGMARLAVACGDCHRSANIHSALRAGPSSGLGGGGVGHMLEHEQAADQLHSGLVEPSDPLWRRGAETLATAPLKKSQMPRDPKLTDAVFAAEKQAHEIADRAQRAATPCERVELYGRFRRVVRRVSRLHERMWGPGVLR